MSVRKHAAGIVSPVRILLSQETFSIEHCPGIPKALGEFAGSSFRGAVRGWFASRDSRSTSLRGGFRYLEDEAGTSKTRLVPTTPSKKVAARIFFQGCFKDPSRKYFSMKGASRSFLPLQGSVKDFPSASRKYHFPQGNCEDLLYASASSKRFSPKQNLPEATPPTPPHCTQPE